MNNEETGFVFAATGNKEYFNLAVQAAKSIRKYLPDANIDLFTDHEVENDVFSKIHLLEDPWFRSKIDAMILSRFQYTIYLDADLIVIDDISDIFTVLERFDMAFAHDQGRYSFAAKNPWKKDFPDSFPQVNSGVIGFRKNERTSVLLKTWKEQLKASDFKKDQPLLRELMWKDGCLNFYILPPEYNLMHLAMIDRLTARRGLPKIIHSSKLYAHIHSKRKKISNLEQLLGCRRLLRLIRIHQDHQKKLLNNLDLPKFSLTRIIHFLFCKK